MSISSFTTIKNGSTNAFPSSKENLCSEIYIMKPLHDELAQEKLNGPTQTSPYGTFTNNLAINTESESAQF